MLDWQSLLAALALVLIIEGVLPFINPSGLRSTLAKLSELSDGQLRTMGAVSMVIGVVFLYFVRN